MGGGLLACVVIPDVGEAKELNKYKRQFTGLKFCSADSVRFWRGAQILFIHTRNAKVTFPHSKAVTFFQKSHLKIDTEAQL